MRRGAPQRGHCRGCFGPPLWAETPRCMTSDLLHRRLLTLARSVTDSWAGRRTFWPSTRARRGRRPEPQTVKPGANEMAAQELQRLADASEDDTAERYARQRVSAGPGLRSEEHTSELQS